MFKYASILAVLLLMHTPAHAQRITHIAQGNGAAATQGADGSHMLHLAGQSFVGVAQNGTETNRAGFLYALRSAYAPTVIATIADVDLIAGGSPFTLNLQTIFSDPDDDPLHFEARSSNSTVATGEVSNQTLVVSPHTVGSATITVVADDGQGGRRATSFAVRVPTGVATEDLIDVPTAFALVQNYPNPFNPETTIAFDVPQTAHVTVTIYDLTGQHVATLVSGTYAAGRHAATWDATGFASGLYVYRLRAGSYSATRKMVLMK